MSPCGVERSEPVGGGIRPTVLIVELDRGLANRNVIQASTSFGLYVGLVNPIMND